MKALILLLFFSMSSAQMVEIKFPEFSEKVKEQGRVEKAKASEHCSTSNVDGSTAEVTCGTEKQNPVKPVKLGELGDDNSNYAQDQVRKNGRTR